jgi:hypothetical protein
LASTWVVSDVLPRGRKALVGFFDFTIEQKCPLTSVRTWSE